MILSDRFRQTALRSRLSKRYIVIAILFGLSTLIIPFATQYLVNSLALSSLVGNTVIFLVLLLVFLSLSQVLRYGQFILLEYLQREIFISEARRWVETVRAQKSHYMLEIQAVMKSFSLSFSHLVELGLSILFGFLVIMSLHPAFLVLPLLTAGTIWLVFSSWRPALASSVKESDEKYKMVENKFEGNNLSDGDFADFLGARDAHFFFIRRATIIVSSAFVISQLILLGLGIVFIESEELSVGQLVAAEIILTGIMVSVTKLPKTMESLYDLETSMIKLEKALGENP